MLKKKNKGFLVSDALVCVMIVSVICSVITICVITHTKIKDGIQTQSIHLEEDMYDFYHSLEGCILCTPETTEEAY